MDYTELNYVVQDAVATIELNRPDQLNALTFRLEAELYQAIADADADPEVRTILVTGAGRAFCAGMDISQLEGLPPEDIRSRRHMRTFDMNRRADYQTRYSYFPA
ncbi:enoyl-CoA hydratase-related protein, partial [Cupriavidus necator]